MDRDCPRSEFAFFFGELDARAYPQVRQFRFDQAVAIEDHYVPVVRVDQADTIGAVEVGDDTCMHAASAPIAIARQ